MSAPARDPLIEPAGFRPAGEFPCNAEGVGLALLYLIIDQDRSLTSRAGNQPVAAYLLDLYAECLKAANGQRVRGARAIETIQ